MEDKLIEQLNKIANFKAVKSEKVANESQLLGFTCRTDFYNEEIAINALTKLIIDYIDNLDIPYDLVEIVNIDKKQFKDLHRFGLDSYFITVEITGKIY